MAITELQREICQVIAKNRIASGESYVAGGVALNLLTGGSRYSDDVDIFHDTEEALNNSWSQDLKSLEANGFRIEVTGEWGHFKRARIWRGSDFVDLDWGRDSSYRFFPLVEHPVLGLTVHPFDLATNKVLALVGRLVVRDWVDTILCCERVQPLAYLAFAASGKDPGFSPPGVISHAGRASRYSQVEVDTLAFKGPRPDAGDLSRRWHRIMDESKEVVKLLPPDESGKCVLDSSGNLFRGNLDELKEALQAKSLLFHEGRIRGAWPQIRGLFLQAAPDQ